MIKGRGRAKADDNLVGFRLQRLCSDRIDSAVRPQSARFIDFQRYTPADRFEPGNKRINAEIFLAENLKIVQRTRNNGRDECTVLFLSIYIDGYKGNNYTIVRIKPLCLCVKQFVQ